MEDWYSFSKKRILIYFLILPVMDGPPVDEGGGRLGGRGRHEGPEGQLAGEDEEQEHDQQGRRRVVHYLIQPSRVGVRGN